MKLRINVFSLSLMSALVWAATVVIATVMHTVYPSSSVSFLKFLASVGPGFHLGTGVVSSGVGAVYGFLYGGIAGAAFGGFYNLVADMFFSQADS